MFKSKKLTEWQEEALLAIREFTRRRHRAIMPEEFEEIMFPEVYKRGKSRGLVGGGHLGRLAAAGLVRRVYRGGRRGGYEEMDN